MSAGRNRPRLPAGDPATPLRAWLCANAVFSFTTGAVITAAPGSIGDQLGTDQTGLVRLAGVALVAYAVDLVLVARTRWQRLGRIAPIVVAADGTWVLGTILVLIARLVEPSSGQLLLAAIGAAVGALALGQLRSLRHARSAHGDGLQTEAAERGRVTA